MHNIGSSTKPSELCFIKDISGDQTIFQEGQKKKEKGRSYTSPCGQPSGLSSGGTGTMEVQTMHSIGPPEIPDPNWQLWGSYVPCMTVQVLAGSW